MKIKKASYLLGMDIRQNFVRLTALSCCNAGYQIEACVYASLDNSEVSDATLIDLIRGLLKQIPSKIKEVAVALTHSAVISREIEVDADLTAEEMQDFLHFKLMEYIGESNAKLYFDYSPGVTVNGYKVVAARYEQVEKLLKLLSEFDLVPKIIDVDMYALERAVRYQLKIVTGLVAIISIDYGNILIEVLDHEKIVYMCEDNIGEENLNSTTQVIAQLDLKMKVICSELLQPLNKIVLGGEKANLFGLADGVSSQLNTKVIIANPFLDMTLSAFVDRELADTMAPLMLISSGLALRVADDNSN